MNLKLLLNPPKLLKVVKYRFQVRANLDRAVKAGVKKFKNHSDYRPDLVLQGVAPHPGPAQDDSAILKRIITAYKKAKVDQRLHSDTFNVSNEWLHIYERGLGPVMRALDTEDLPALNAMYANFFRDACSHGLAGLPLDTHKKLFQPNPALRYRNVLLVDLLHRYELWKQRTANKYSVGDLTSPPIGNPYGHIFQGTFVRAGSDYHHYYAQAINGLLPKDKKGIVLELGGGFGGMAYFLVRDNPNVSYIDFDPPEAVALASYYLLKAFPGLPVTLYGEADLSPSTIANSRIILMPSFEILKLAPKSVDVAFNSYSLAEMSPSAIREYVKEITRATSGYFLHINFTKISVVSADDFGIEKHGFTLLNRELAGWTVGLNPVSDECEFLYKAD